MEGTPTVSQELDFGPKPTPPFAQGKKTTSSAAICWEHQFCDFFFGLDFLRKTHCIGKILIFFQVEVNPVLPYCVSLSCGSPVLLHRVLTSDTAGHQMCGFFSPTSLQQQPGVLLFNSVPTLSTLR